MSDKEAQVDWDDDGFLDIDECYDKIRHKIGQLYTRLAMLDSVEATLADCGTDGFYAEFDTPADAIVQMDDRAQLVTPELASLLEYLAEGIDCLAPAEDGISTPKTDEARTLAAEIREVLDDSQA